MTTAILTDRETGMETHDVAVKRGMAMAYVWGRQDAGESERDTGYSQTFAAVYAMAHYLTDGMAGPLQALYHEWHETGRVLVRLSGTGRIVQVAATGRENMVEAHPVPYAGTYLRYWPGIVRKPNSE